MVDETAIAVAILSESLPTVEVTTEFSDGSLSAMGEGRRVIVSHTADESDAFLQVSTVELLCCAETDSTAAALARSCVEVLQEAAADHPLLSEARVVEISRDSFSTRGGRHRASMRLYINIE